MLDKAKLPPDIWARILWLPADDSDRSQRPIVLVTDRPRFLIGGIPAVAALFVAVVLLLARGRAARGGEAGGLAIAGGGGGSFVICTRYIMEAISNWMSLSSSWKAWNASFLYSTSGSFWPNARSPMLSLKFSIIVR